MARPKIPNIQKKESMNLSLSPEIKEMAEYVRIKKGISISKLIEIYIRTEYQKLVKIEKKETK